MGLIRVNLAVAKRIPHFILCLGLMLLSPLLLANKQPTHQEQLKSSTLRIAVAANFAPVLEQLTSDFAQQHNIELQLIKGATGTLFQQIKHGAPFDVFMAADALRPKTLEQQKLIQPNSRATYALGELAYWSATTQVNSLSDLSALNQDSNKQVRIAIANPNVAPYGKAAKETLQSLNIWQKLQNSLIIGINVGQTFQQVRSKAVASGIVAHSQLKLNNLSGVLIPAQYHQPIEQQLVITKASKNIDSANAFVQYILSPNIQRKIVNFGYQSLNQKPVNQQLANQKPRL